MDSKRKFCCRRALQYVPLSTQGECLIDIGLVTSLGHEDDPIRGKRSRSTRATSSPPDAGHGDVEDDEIGTEPRRDLYCLRSVVRVAHYLATRASNSGRRERIPASSIRPRLVALQSGCLL